MADVENQQDSSFPVKRKSDLCCQDQDNVANKAQKLNPSSSSSSADDSESKHGNGGVEILNSSTDEKLGTESSDSIEKAVAEDKQEGEEDLVEAEIERKGKGISREDKGKGKLMEVDESDDTDDGDDDGDDGDEYDESDLSDDPLAEVDLDNILPSRTRRRSFQPGVYISNDRIENHEEDDDDDDSSDDSDV